MTLKDLLTYLLENSDNLDLNSEVHYFCRNEDGEIIFDDIEQNNFIIHNNEITVDLK